MKILTTLTISIITLILFPNSFTVAEPSHDWSEISKCESSQNWHINTGNGYYGGLQFDGKTWLSNGGGLFAPRADLATKQQQIEIAELLYSRRGSQPWPVCGKYIKPIKQFDQKQNLKN